MCNHIYIYIYTHIHTYARSPRRPSPSPATLGEITGLALLVQYGLVCFIRVSHLSMIA